MALDHTIDFSGGAEPPKLPLCPARFPSQAANSVERRSSKRTTRFANNWRDGSRRRRNALPLCCWKVFLCEPSADGPGTQTELLSDLSGGHALLLELYHLLILLAATFIASALHPLDEGRARGLSRSNWNGSS